MALTATFASRFASLSPPQHDTTDTESLVSSQGISSSPVSSIAQRAFDTRSCLSDTAVTSPATCEALLNNSVRRNEHLAVLLPKHLWKPDSQASHCDIFLCRKRFTIFERKHHCRKCGGVFCAHCSLRATPLLDTSTLDFLNPPRNVPISTFASPTSPVVLSRVCNDCWDQIHGTEVFRSLVKKHTATPISMQQWETDSSASSVSGSPRSPPTPLDGSAIMPMPPVRSPLRRSQTSPRIPTSPLRAGTSTPPPQRPSVHVSDSELDSYPLRHASAICKATGGGRWEPKPAVQYAGYRIPGSKAQYEIDLERDAEEARIKRANPVIKDGDFQLRVPHELEPHSLGGPYQFSTF